MKNRSAEELKQRRLVRMLGLFFFALLIPTVVLLYFAYSQMKWEVYHQYRLQAEALVSRINTRIDAIVHREEARKFADYRFLIVAPNDARNTLSRSELSELPAEFDFPGLLGYFQIDPQGRFSSPLIPESGIDPSQYGVSNDDLNNRRRLAEELKNILNRPVPDPVEGPPDQPARDIAAKDLTVAGNKPDADAGIDSETQLFQRFDEGGAGAIQQNTKRLGSVSALNLDERLEKKSEDKRKAAPAASAPLERLRTPQPRAARKEQAAVYELAPRQSKLAEMFAEEDAAQEYELDDLSNADFAPEAVLAETEPATLETRIRTFESEIGPIDLENFGDSHFVLFRNVWRDGERFIQGAVVDREAFLGSEINDTFRASSLMPMSRLIVALDDDVLNVFERRAESRYPLTSDAMSGEVLFRNRLTAPLDQLSLIFTVTELPLGTSVRFLVWVGFVLFSVIVGGCLVIYRFGRGQIALFRQQQDFVSAVSHELKTPLTSIRMYSEMLKQGWADESKKAGYYEYIHDESERLSRLIANVLQLARMNRNGHDVDLRTVTVGQLMSDVSSKISSLAEATGFSIVEQIETSALDESIEVDPDAFMQIVINIVDNAIKFSRGAEEKKIELRCSRLSNGQIEIGVRDFGPGIEPKQMKKIFELFYRSENELTRETIGTGIGLALVHQLTLAMHGTVDVQNRNPGAEFTLIFPIVHQR